MKRKMSRISIILIIILCISIIGAGGYLVYDKILNKDNKPKVDDWKYDSRVASKDFGIRNSSSGSSYEAAMDGGNIGFSTGGAKDINNFRENIKNGYFPIFTDITYNGLFYDYTFDTGQSDESKDLFSPSYSLAVSKDPISKQDELYMTVGLNSNIKESDFKRKKLNLVVVLDISGSMGSPFNRYYYDQFVGNDKETEDDKKSKMQIANESVNILLDKLNDDDRFGMVLFESEAYLGKPLSLVKNTDMEKIKKHILDIKDVGGTNFEAGYTMGTDLYKDYMNINSNEYENRIIVITDAMPNYGNTSDKSLMDYVKENANKGIYTTFIGVGVDFNTKLIETISDSKGANYYSVHSSSEFKKRMGEEFEYMVTPLVFDLELNFDSNDYQIEKVYGTDTKDNSSNSIMKVNTLFPSKTNDGEVKGGVVLLKLKNNGNKNNGEVNINVSYKDRSGISYNNSKKVNINAQEEQYDNTGIRKAIVLTRYVNVLKNWILYERTGEKRFIILPKTGIINCDYSNEEIKIMLGENERTSVNLSVSEEYKNLFKKIREYIINERNNINDDTLNKEIEILDLLLK